MVSHILHNKLYTQLCIGTALNTHLCTRVELINSKKMGVCYMYSIVNMIKILIEKDTNSNSE